MLKSLFHQSDVYGLSLWKMGHGHMVQMVTCGNDIADFFHNQLISYRLFRMFSDGIESVFMVVNNGRTP